MIDHPEAYCSDVMEGSPPPPDKRVTLPNWAQTIASIRRPHVNGDRVCKTVPIEKDYTPAWLVARKANRQAVRRPTRISVFCLELFAAED